jgi:hypothetical protein
MMDNTPSPLSNVITVDDDRIKNHRKRPSLPTLLATG